jgi:DNA-binding response OmpR family regulator
MRILIAEDDAVSRRVLQTLLGKWGHEVISTCDGNEAWEAIQRDDAPALVMLDWMMPGIDGVELVRRTRLEHCTRPFYLILLTAKGSKENIVEGFEAGADDFISKPFHREELRARVNAGVRILQLQKDLTRRVNELQEALANVTQLQGLLPICCYCKNIRNDQNYWQEVETYIGEHSGTRFSHGICPECYEKVMKPSLERSKLEKQAEAEAAVVDPSAR